MISLLRYPGGKFYMLEDIKEIFNKSGKTTIIDVFGGSGKVLMNLNAKIKVYNDINNSLINFFSELKEHKEEVLKKLDYVLNSREMFERYRKKSKDNLENAFRFLYNNILSFNGEGRSYSYSTKRNKSITLVNINNVINKSYNDIKYWTIERLDFREIIRRYDSENSFFYLDPPYHNITDLYDDNLKDEDYADIKKSLDRIKGKYLLNINEDEFVLKLFGKPQKRKEFTNFGINGRTSPKTKRVELFYYK
ncbi:DNA adenine methylase [Ferroplasma sp.]|uniref:DNA adenine methylase n=1 Tax=Ferroplasma sp. TaxID=2591003 RepID=UPI002631E795|nr:DNA adenine methylase [Ferroplasma sp.]